MKLLRMQFWGGGVLFRNSLSAMLDRVMVVSPSAPEGVGISMRRGRIEYLTEFPSGLEVIECTIDSKGRRLGVQ